MEAKKSFKKDKFSQRVLNDMNAFLRQRFTDSRLRFVSFSKVDLSQDFSKATVYWDTFDASSRGDAKKAIEHIGSKMRSMLASSLQVRHVPELDFRYDGQFEAERKIDELLGLETMAGRGIGQGQTIDE